MRNLIVGFMLGIIVDIILGWIKAEDWDDYRISNDPNYKEFFARRQRMKMMEQLINETEDR